MNLIQAAEAVKLNPTDENIIKLVVESARTGDDVGYGGNRNWNNEVESVRAALRAVVIPVETVVEVEKKKKVKPEPVVVVDTVPDVEPSGNIE